MATITGNNANNYLNGTAGNDTIYGLDGDDTLVGNAGTDSLIGGNGDDRYWVKDAGDIVVENGTGYDAVWSEISYTLTANVEELDLLGTANINGTGNSGDNWLFDNAGNNLLSGLDGNDTLVSTLGGHDTLVGGNGDDTYWINDASTVITETNTTDWDAVWSEVTYTLPTNVEELDLLGTANINGTGNTGDNFLFGNSGDNKLDGFSGNDTLIGNAGNDTLQGGGGADSMQGGAGDDYYYVDNAGDVVSEETTVGVDDGGYDHVASSITYTLGAHIEELDQIGSANIDGTGNALDNYIYGNSGNNLLSGMAGNDTIQATSGGLDTLVGGTGDDTYWINSASTVIIETNTTDWDAVWSEVTYTLPTNVEELDLLGTANINGTGNAGVNFLYGNSGNNTLWGLAGNDTLIGNGGVDTLYGGKGDDIYYVDNSADVVSEESTGVGISDGGHDLVYSSASFTLGAFVEDLTLTGTADLVGTGNRHYNALTGNDGNNTLWGLGGNDTLNGGNGEDTLYGGAGDDTYYVNSAGDVASEQSSGVGINDGGHDIVYSSVSYAIGTFIEDLTLTGTGDINGTGNDIYANLIIGNSGNNYLSGLNDGDTLIGNDGNDTLDGGLGHDSLDGGNGTDLLLGGSGSDTLIGGAGNDTLNGGNAADTFVFAAAGAANGVDVVQDFVHGSDQLLFTGADYGFAAGHSLTASEFTAGSAAVGASAQFVWDAATHTLYFDHDGAGGDAAIALATFNAGANLSASDFHFG